MKITCVPKEGRRGVLTLFIDDEPWRDIHRTIFGRAPKFKTLSEFEDAESAGARRYALWRLSRYAQSAYTLLSALERLLVSEACRQRVVDELTTAGYVNDQDYSKRLVARETARGRGPASARAKLFRKGIDPELANAVVQDIDEDQQRASIQRWLTTRYAKHDLTDYRERQKVIGALMRRGFALDIIHQSLTFGPNA
jgi:regulatory protein